jgi:glycine dehydrogenase
MNSAPWGSAGILPIAWSYLRLMGPTGLTKASQTAILNANYVAFRLKEYFPILYTGKGGRVAHECILDCRGIRKASGITVSDIAKRLMDYGFHAPTVSFPVADTLMVEPTESESREELDRFCDAMIAIREEIEEIVTGQADPENNVLCNAPHTAEMVTSDEWEYPYSRAKAAYPREWIRESKFWPACRRIDDTWGDRNLFCSCVLPESFTGE